MLCPFCLEKTSAATNCANCKEALPPLYVNNQNGFTARKPAIFSAVGFSGHGKTVYLAAMLHAMKNQLTRAWPKFYRQGLDVDTVRTVQENLARLQKGDLPESTRRNFPRPSVHLLAEIPNYGSRTLLIYDPPGEAFDSDEGIGRYAHFVRNAAVVVFLVSLADLQAPKEDDLYRLLNTYFLGMARLKAKTKQHLVVTYTKADLLTEILGRYPTVIQHLCSPDYRNLSNPKRYLETLKVVSNELMQFTTIDMGARDFMRLATKEFKSVEFCAISALGNAPENGHLSTSIEPRRVADPLLWVIEKSS